MVSFVESDSLGMASNSTDQSMTADLANKPEEGQFDSCNTVGWQTNFGSASQAVSTPVQRLTTLGRDIGTVQLMCRIKWSWVPGETRTQPPGFPPQVIEFPVQ